MQQKEIHYQFSNQPYPVNELLAEVEQWVNAGVNALRLSTDTMRVDSTIGKRIKALCGGQTHLIIMDDVAYAKSIGADGLLLSQPLKLPEGADALQIGGQATDLADCKNWELFGAAYIDLNPKNGDEEFGQIIPITETYGWMFASLNLPVIASGISNKEELTKIVRSAAIDGCCITEAFHPELTPAETVELAKGILSQSGE